MRADLFLSEGIYKAEISCHSCQFSRFEPDSLRLGSDKPEVGFGLCLQGF
jgi:hypothetical protein